MTRLLCPKQIGPHEPLPPQIKAAHVANCEPPKSILVACYFASRVASLTLLQPKTAGSSPQSAPTCVPACRWGLLPLCTARSAPPRVFFHPSQVLGSLLHANSSRGRRSR